MKNVTMWLIMGLMVFHGCVKGPKTSSKKIKSHFTDAYIDLLYFRERHNHTLPAYEDSVTNILVKHHLTRSEYMEMIDALNQKPERWETFLQEVLDQLSSMDSTRIGIVADPAKHLHNRAVE